MSAANTSNVANNAAPVGCTTLRDLHSRFGGAIRADVIDMIFHARLEEHRATAHVQDFVPLIAGREAAEELASLAPGMLTVEFIARNTSCARAAAALANLRSGVRATAAPTHPEDDCPTRLDRELAQLGLCPERTVRRRRTMQAADVVVRLGEDAPERVGKRVETWAEADFASVDALDLHISRALRRFQLEKVHA